MASTKVITARYIEFISEQVIDRFGGSYQTVQSLGKIWRQEMPYNLKIEQFILEKTKLFLRMLDICDLGNFNMMYKVCYNISEYVSKYTVKKSPDSTRKQVTDNMLNSIFFDSDTFVSRFKRAYKRPIDMTNERWVACNPGVVAMYKAVQSR